MSSSDTSSLAIVTDAVIVYNQTLLNINMTNITKLTATNYLMWKLQVEVLLAVYGLLSHLDGYGEIPPATLTTADVVSPNPAYALWLRQDQLIYSSLLGSISLSMQSILSRTTTATEIWTTLRHVYVKPLNLFGIVN
ncbi:PREDICTED: uncharacterized protein LOC104707638 [Camelina sativa]|uniref:Uncharacterized protein LOC104707638 n=1 Tax=Camelina sativa TaxID=90675 RepID=A0ABM0T863_CAMSA|nr:PREDICTED: uncharacterized protein LOC104707638 [Camelina sativa]